MFARVCPDLIVDEGSIGTQTALLRKALRDRYLLNIPGRGYRFLSWELRTSISLSQMYREQGQTHAAGDALTRVDARFKEGFNTVDLKAAKAPINELSQ